MDQSESPHYDFENEKSQVVASPSEDHFVVDIAGYEGPLDLLLILARSQKVDLARVSILALAEQYLHFINTARKLKIELAADYLVMAAWLAYLKSRLLIPNQQDEDEPSAEEMAEELAFRLKRLEAMREAATKLMDRNLLGRDVLQRGSPEDVKLSKKSVWNASLYDLLMAYAVQRQRNSITLYKMERRRVWSLKEAQEILKRLLGHTVDWVPIEKYLRQFLNSPDERSTVLASSFSASLELVRQGTVELRQASAFDTLYIRMRSHTVSAST